MKFLFISTHNLATNPRFFKEILLAKRLGHDVEVVCFEFTNWSFEYNKQLLKTLYGCKIHIIPADRRPFLQWIFSVSSEKLFKKTDRLIHLKGRLLAQSTSRRNYLILRKIRKISGQFDWIIGHNPGALYATRYAAGKFGCKWGFDVEDFHPGESGNPTINNRAVRYLKENLSGADYLTFASPLIKSETEKIAGLKPSEQHQIIFNYFPREEFFAPKETKNDSPLKLIWFSQKISFDRGLEPLIPIINRMNDIQLHLVGHMDQCFEKEQAKNRANVFIHPPLAQSKLHKSLEFYDIGIAFEPGKDLNNKIALSNKILAYQQAGLYILASDTQAQKDFIVRHPNIGLITSLDPDSLSAALDQLVSQKEKIRDGKQKRFVRSRNFSWEEEAIKIKVLWEGKYISDHSDRPNSK